MFHFVPTRVNQLAVLVALPLVAVAIAGCQQGATVGSGSSFVQTTPSATPKPVTTTASPVSTATAIATATATANATPTATPTATSLASAMPTPFAVATDSVFASIGASGVEAFTTAGAPLVTYASSTGADEVALDASGNTYVLSTSGFGIAVSRYAIGAQNPNASYSPTSPRPQLLFAGSNGTLVVAGAGSDANGNPTGVYDFWDPGVTGAPSRTLTYPIETLGLLNGAMATDGTFYLPYSSATGQVRYDVLPPGASTPSRTIVESIAQPNTDFSASAMTIGSDGTLYVGEWTYVSPDANAGLYIYPTTGAESMMTQGATNPTGIGLDASANVYVSNSNATVGPDSNLTTDTLHELSVFSPKATALASMVSSGLDDPQDLAVDDDGTAYLVDDANADQTTSPILVVRPGATSATAFAAVTDATNVVLFDGSRVRSTRIRSGHASGGRSVRAARFKHRFPGHSQR